ncbi:alpha-mannosyltransferase [Aspergillus undulatus]|uniref:alpha-mannosyltransferase n=1 Tax=Aspergillus undulatus TaxID=1810928 RepID=UPI003CCE07A8
MFARRRAIPFFVATLLLLNIYYLWHKHAATLSIPDQRAQLWRRLSTLLESHAPPVAKLTQSGGPGVVRFSATDEISRLNYIDNVDEIVQPLQEAHDGFVHDMKKIKGPKGYVPGSMGIVSSAGGTYLPTFVVTLRLLRRTGTTLPIELFLKDKSEYEPVFCEEVLPALNVECLILSDIMRDFDTPDGQAQSEGEDENKSKIDGFQLKAFAMLFTSFEKFLWLDADCVPLHDTAPLLSTEPFTSHGLVTWPDFFADTAAPVYFNISRQPDPPSTKRQSSEAGMLLVNKETHFPTLLLSAYYNYHGPDYYYPLTGQGAPGAGDKDTFLNAAGALSQSYYAVSERVVDLGNVTPWNPDTAVNAGYIQADPLGDFDLTREGKYRVVDETIAKAPRAFFIHAGAPEFNPGNELMGQKLRGFNGKPTRLWTFPDSAMRRLGVDAERMFWEEVLVVACTLEDAFNSWKKKKNICSKVRKHWEDVFLDEEREVPAFTEAD